MHWAAAVNNLDAVRVLIAHGVNKDAQDNKEETPLFLAAREGSFEAVKLLLENLANKEITDHMDRLPCDVARERRHKDIVRLLEEYVPPSPQISNGHLTGGSPMFLMGMHSSTKAKPKRRSKLVNGTMLGKDGEQDNGLRRKPSMKKKGRDLTNMGMQVVEGSISLSPDSGQNGMDNNSEPIYTQLTNVSHTQPNNQKSLPPYNEHIIYNYALSGGGGKLQQIGQVYLDSSGALQNVPSHHIRQNSVPGNNSNVVAPPSRPYTSTSPTKQRPSLPTSPTHMAAMRAAHHQRTNKMHPANNNGGNNIYDYPPDAQGKVPMQPQNNGQQQQQQNNGLYHFHYPTPPSQHSHSGGETTPHYLHPPENTYLTPSPESPGQWSSSSPHSVSDWSESMASPMGHNLHSLHSVDQHQKATANGKAKGPIVSPQVVFI